MKRNRALLSLAPIAVSALLLAGCSGSGGAVDSAIAKDANGVECLAAGAASTSIAVEGDFSGDLTLTSKTPIETEGVERSVLIEGETEPFAADENVKVRFTLFNGKTGELVNGDEGELPNTEEYLSTNPGFYDAVRCGAPGQRTAITIPVGEALGDTDPADVGFSDLAKEDTFVMVFDFAKPFVEFEECEDVTPRDEKYPQVELGDGTTAPEVTIPECMEAPSEIEVEVLEEGTGPVVEEGQSVMTNYAGFMWNGGVHFQTSWDETGIRLETNGVVPGFKAAMVGQKIGSTILVSMPSEDAYNDGARTFVLQLVSLAE